MRACSCEFHLYLMEVQIYSKCFFGQTCFFNAFEKHDYCSIFVILSMLPAAKNKERKDVPKNAKSAGESCCNAPNPVGQALNIKY